MIFNNQYPYTDLHELNLDWVLRRIRELGIRMDDFEAANQMSYGGNWDITSQYPAWTIVSDANTAYISLKPVPAGVPVSNNDYWQPIFDYAGLYNRVTFLEGEMAGAQNDIDGLQRFNQFQDTKLLCIGDSYGMKISDNWPYWLAQHMGLDSNHITNMCTGNAGFVGNPGFQTFYEQLQNAPGDKSTYTHILIVGGFNDAYRSDGTQANLYDIEVQMRNCKAYIEANYPNAKVYIGCPAAVCNANDPVTAAAMRGSIGVIRNMYSFVGAEMGWAYMDGCAYALHDTDYLDLTDVVYGCVFHPNSQGNRQLARCIQSYIAGGDYYQANNHNIVFTPQTGVTVGGSPEPITENIENDVVEICETGPLEFNFATPLAYNIIGSVKLGEVNHACLFPGNDDRLTATVKCIINGTVPALAQIYFKGNDLNIWIDAPYGYTTNISSVAISSFKITTDIRIN